MAISLKFPEIPESRTKALTSKAWPADYTVTGTVEFSATNKKKVYGSGTSFLTSVSVGDSVYNYTDDKRKVDAGEVEIPVMVKSIQSNTELTLVRDYQGETGPGKTMTGFRCENQVGISGDMIDISGS
jgi:hypothetical protein